MGAVRGDKGQQQCRQLGGAGGGGQPRDERIVQEQQRQPLCWAHSRQVPRILHTMASPLNQILFEEGVSGRQAAQTKDGAVAARYCGTVMSTPRAAERLFQYVKHSQLGKSSSAAAHNSHGHCREV